jgi:hypothetical protein
MFMFLALWLCGFGKGEKKAKAVKGFFICYMLALTPLATAKAAAAIGYGHARPPSRQLNAPSSTTGNWGSAQ